MEWEIHFDGKSVETFKHIKARIINAKTIFEASQVNVDCPHEAVNTQYGLKVLFKILRPLRLPHNRLDKML